MEEIKTLIASKRNILWSNDVNEKDINSHSQKIMDLYFEKPDEPVLVTVLSNSGGPCHLGFGFYDLIKEVIKPKLYTLVSGSTGSMGVVVFCSATEKRFMTKNSTLFIHQIGTTTAQAGIRYTTTEVVEWGESLSKLQNTYIRILIESSGGKIDKETLFDLMKKETRLNAQEALKYGLCDEII